MSSTRSPRAVSKEMSLIGCAYPAPSPRTNQPRTAHGTRRNLTHKGRGVNGKPAPGPFTGCQLWELPPGLFPMLAPVNQKWLGFQQIGRNTKPWRIAHGEAAVDEGREGFGKHSLKRVLHGVMLK